MIIRLILSLIKLVLVLIAFYTMVVSKNDSATISLLWLILFLGSIEKINFLYYLKRNADEKQKLN